MSWARYNAPKRQIFPSRNNPVPEVNKPNIIASNPAFQYSEDETRLCLEQIDAICYINLEHRTDRKEHILNEIHKFCKDESKIYGIDAIKKENGALGCGLSHIKTLEFVLSHPEWKTVLILEDDFTFKSNNSNEITHYIRRLLESNSNLDMGLLSYNQLKSDNTNDGYIKKVLYAQTTSSYLVKREYIPTLLSNFKESMGDMEQNGKRHDNCLDIHWTKLQAINNWYAIYPAIGYQYDNYSDIENKHCTYGC
jgi:glycosyl transferase family 25